MDQQKDARTVQRRARGLQRIASILDAAETVFACMGYEEATTNHIAAQTQISPGSLYQFFANKEEIAQALASRYTEELQQAYDTIFSVEAAALPLPLWLDQIFDTLIAFHLSHPAFHILLNTAVSSRVTSLTQELPLELQARFERGFERRAPALALEQCRLSAMMSVQLFKATLMQILKTDEDGRRRLVSALKTVLRRYLEPLTQGAARLTCARSLAEAAILRAVKLLGICHAVLLACLGCPCPHLRFNFGEVIGELAAMAVQSRDFLIDDCTDIDGEIGGQCA
jgi:AcrR family transcriptional regulator